MLKDIMSTLKKTGPLKEVNPGEFRHMKISVMNFDVHCFELEDIGTCCVMEMSGLFGLMKMQTVVITPSKVDAPLFSYDGMRVFGKDKTYLELYETTLEEHELPLVARVKERYSAVEDFNPGTHWYDSIRRKESLYKTAKKDDRIPMMEQEYLEAFLESLKTLPSCDPDAKTEKNAAYVEGLIENGGPAVDQFLKKFGKEKTAQFLRCYMFGTLTD